MSIKYEFSCYSINDSIQCNSFKKSIMQMQLMLICVLRHLTDGCNCMPSFYSRSFHFWYPWILPWSQRLMTNLITAWAVACCTSGCVRDGIGGVCHLRPESPVNILLHKWSIEKIGKSAQGHHRLQKQETLHSEEGWKMSWTRNKDND